MSKIVYLVLNTNSDFSCVHDDAERAEKCRLVKNAAYQKYAIDEYKQYTVEEVEMCGGPFNAVEG